MSSAAARPIALAELARTLGPLQLMLTVGFVLMIALGLTNLLAVLWLGGAIAAAEPPNFTPPILLGVG